MEQVYGLNNSFSASDLALERRRADTSVAGIDYKKERVLGGVWERIRVSTEEGAKSIDRPIGSYNTLNVRRMDLLTPDAIEDASDELARELCSILDGERVVPDKILVIGLGNRHLTPDAVGPLSADEVRATMHLDKRERRIFEELECSRIAVISPGVTENSGISTANAVKGIASVVEPDVIFAIDALASRSVDRLGTTVQISTTGIFPGSGLGGAKGAINKQTVGVPVIAIGIPTVINMGMLGKSTPITGTEKGMFVSPKEIDGIVRTGAKIIGGAINQAFGIYC